jgi:hypothetical protein
MKPRQLVNDNVLYHSLTIHKNGAVAKWFLSLYDIARPGIQPDV